MLRFTLTFAAVSTLVAAFGCDDKKPAPKPEKVAAPAPSSEFEKVGDGPSEATGLAASRDAVIEWKHTFDGNEIVDIAMCKDDLVTVTSSGRMVTWNPKKMVPLGVIDTVGAVSAIDVRNDEAIVGTATGEFIAADCSFLERRSATNRGYPVEFIGLDHRSGDRALTIMRRPEGLEGSTKNLAVASHVNLLTGKSVRRPFEVPIGPNSEILGFADYRGELWLGVTDADRTTIWYLERFDRDQPKVQGLPDAARILGLGQIGREVWAHGSHDDGQQGLIVRIDSSAKAKSMWDGKEAWFGEQPGGDIPDGPITGVLQLGENLLVVTPDAVRRTDQELRRWKKLPTGSGAENPFERIVDAVRIGDEYVVATQYGLAKIDKDGWKLWRLPGFDTSADSFEEVTDDAFWNGAEYAVDDGKLVRTDPKAGKDQKRPHKIRGDVTLVIADELDRLWVFGSERTHLLERRGGNVEKSTWKTADIGLDPRAVTHHATGEEGGILALRFADGGVLKLRRAEAKKDGEK